MWTKLLNALGIKTRAQRDAEARALSIQIKQNRMGAANHRTNSSNDAWKDRVGRNQVQLGGDIQQFQAGGVLPRRGSDTDWAVIGYTNDTYWYEDTTPPCNETETNVSDTSSSGSDYSSSSDSSSGSSYSSGSDSGSSYSSDSGSSDSGSSCGGE